MVALTMAAYLVKYLYSPVAFEFSDEFLHWRTLRIGGVAHHRDGEPPAAIGRAAIRRDRACWFDTDTDTDTNYDWHVDQTTAAWQAWLALAATRTSTATARNVLH